jgi:hypothetical protein
MVGDTGFERVPLACQAFLLNGLADHALRARCLLQRRPKWDVLSYSLRRLSSHEIETRLCRECFSCCWDGPSANGRRYALGGYPLTGRLIRPAIHWRGDIHVVDGLVWLSEG